LLKKAEFVLAAKPDILIVPECEHPDRLLFAINIPQPTDMLWFGDNNNKGLGIFSYSHCNFRLLRNCNPAFKMIIPNAVTGSNFTFTPYAVWANNPGDSEGQYAEQTWKAIYHYDKKLKKGSTSPPAILTAIPSGIKNTGRIIIPMW
jgi:hypothetical protein